MFCIMSYKTYLDISDIISGGALGAAAPHFFFSIEVDFDSTIPDF